MLVKDREVDGQSKYSKGYYRLSSSCIDNFVELVVKNGLTNTISYIYLNESELRQLLNDLNTFIEKRNQTS